MEEFYNEISNILDEKSHIDLQISNLETKKSELYKEIESSAKKIAEEYDQLSGENVSEAEKNIIERNRAKYVEIKQSKEKEYGKLENEIVELKNGLQKKVSGLKEKIEAEIGKNEKEIETNEKTYLHNAKEGLEKYKSQLEEERDPQMKEMLEATIKQYEDAVRNIEQRGGELLENVRNLRALNSRIDINNLDSLIEIDKENKGKKDPVLEEKENSEEELEFLDIEAERPGILPESQDVIDRLGKASNLKEFSKIMNDYISSGKFDESQYNLFIKSEGDKIFDKLKSLAPEEKKKESEEKTISEEELAQKKINSDKKMEELKSKLSTIRNKDIYSDSKNKEQLEEKKTEEKKQEEHVPLENATEVGEGRFEVPPQKDGKKIQPQVENVEKKKPEEKKPDKVSRIYISAVTNNAVVDYAGKDYSQIADLKYSENLREEGGELSEKLFEILEKNDINLSTRTFRRLDPTIVNILKNDEEMLLEYAMAIEDHADLPFEVVYDLKNMDKADLMFDTDKNKMSRLARTAFRSRNVTIEKDGLFKRVKERIKSIFNKSERKALVEANRADELLDQYETKQKPIEEHVRNGKEPFAIDHKKAEQRVRESAEVHEKEKDEFAGEEALDDKGFEMDDN